jgi:hypothetical protein
MRFVCLPRATRHSRRPPQPVWGPGSAVPHPILYLGLVFVRGVRGFGHRPMLKRLETGIRLVRQATYSSQLAISGTEHFGDPCGPTERSVPAVRGAVAIVHLEWDIIA